MNDQELIKFVGLATASEKMQAKFLAETTAEKRHLYQSMADLERDLIAAQNGGPITDNLRGAIICGCGHDHDED